MSSFACGEGDDSRVSADEIGGLVDTLSGPEGLRRGPGTLITDRNVLPQPIRELGLDKGWKESYAIAWSSDTEGLSLVLIQADVYRRATYAESRSTGEPEVLSRIFQSLAGANLTPFAPVPSNEGCAGTAIVHPAIVSQFEVYCTVDTVFAFVRVAGTDEERARELASQIAQELVARIEQELELPARTS